MGTLTTPDNLYEPDIGETGWGALVNGNVDKFQTHLTNHSMPGAASYVVCDTQFTPLQGGVTPPKGFPTNSFVAINCRTGAVDQSAANSGDFAAFLQTLINTTIDTTRGGHIYIATGDYNFKSLCRITRGDIRITGAGGREKGGTVGGTHFIAHSSFAPSTWFTGTSIASMAPGPATTIAAGSNGVALPTGTINVAATAGFAASGTIAVATSDGQVLVTYTGTAGGNQFTGCTGGTGTMSTGGAVGQQTVQSTASVFQPMASFLNSAVGAQITIAGAGAAGGLYTGTILAVTDGTHVTVGPATSTSVSGAVITVQYPGIMLWFQGLTSGVDNFWIEHVYFDCNTKADCGFRISGGDVGAGFCRVDEYRVVGIQVGELNAVGSFLPTGMHGKPWTGGYLFQCAANAHEFGAASTVATRGIEMMDSDQKILWCGCSKASDANLYANSGNLVVEGMHNSVGAKAVQDVPTSATSPGWGGSVPTPTETEGYACGAYLDGAGSLQWMGGNPGDNCRQNARVIIKGSSSPQFIGFYNPQIDPLYSRANPAVTNFTGYGPFKFRGSCTGVVIIGKQDPPGGTSQFSYVVDSASATAVNDLQLSGEYLGVAALLTGANFGGNLVFNAIGRVGGTGSTRLVNFTQGNTGNLTIAALGASGNIAHGQLGITPRRIIVVPTNAAAAAAIGWADPANIGAVNFKVTVVNNVTNGAWDFYCVDY